MEQEVPFIIRKIAHFTVYFILAIFTSAVVKLYKNLQPDLLIAWGIAVVYAMTDEYHQTFIPGRVGDWADVSIDAFGAGMAVLLIGLRIQRMERQLIKK